MDNNEIDKILKQKLENQITPSKEFEKKFLNTIKEQKNIEEAKPEIKSKTKIYKKMNFIISMAAVVLIAFVVGINYWNFRQTNTKTAFIKEIKPTNLSENVLASNSEFIIYTEGKDINVESVQKAIYVEPALEYTIKKTSNENEYKLTFEQNIPYNTIVKLQYVKDQITQDSWAYQTSTELMVNKTYPADEETTVSENTVIELEFSYASVENIEKYVEISPKIKGEWEHLGKVWRFTPKQELLKEKYSVTVKNGITAETKILEKDYTFSFTVGEFEPNKQEYYYNTISIDKINTYKPNENVLIYCSGSWMNDEELDISKLEIAKFESKEDFTQYLQNKEYDKAKNLGEHQFKQTTSYVQLAQKLQEGYYVAIIYGTNNKELFNCPIQINELSAYAMETERDVLVWVADGKDLAKDIQVEYNGQTKKTDKQGLAEFKDITDNSDEIRYLNIGNTENKLVVGIYNYNTENYPNAYLYTDRPLYKNTDTINIWGFVPINQFYDKVEQEFYIELNSEGKQKVNIGEDGNINYSIKLNEHIDNEYADISLYYKDTEIAYRSIIIENYEAQNYNYEVIYNKNYAYSGSKFEFDVKVTHITGLVVPNKTVSAKYSDKIYRVKSGEDGIAHFSIEIPDTETLSSGYKVESISIFNGDSQEYTEQEIYIDIYEINKELYTDIKRKDNKYAATIYKLANNKNLILNEDRLLPLYEDIYNTTVKVELKETVNTRYISGYTYNEYTKENEPDYSYEESENIIDIKTVDTKNGTVEVNIEELPLKEDTEEQWYDYELIFTYTDQSGRKIEDTQYIYNEEYLELGEPIPELKDLGYYFDMPYAPEDINHYSYSIFRYLLKTPEIKEVSVGEKLNFTLAESTTSGIKEVDNKGKILRIIYKEDISKKNIIEDNSFDYTFTEEDFPGCNITTAYLKDGKFYRMPTYYFDFKEEDRKVDIEIIADKKQYKPGDEVKLTIKTTNKGNPIETLVNISVANEAVFALKEDCTDLVDTIYYDKDYSVYTYSSYFDYIEYEDLKGGGGRRRR